MTITGSGAVGLPVAPTSSGTRSSPVVRDERAMGTPRGLGISMADEKARVWSTVVGGEDVIARRQRLTRWLGGRCIYCEVKNMSAGRQSIGISLVYGHSPSPTSVVTTKHFNFRSRWAHFRKGECYSYKKDIMDECKTRDS